MAPTLTIQLPEPYTISVSRNDEVGEVLWLRVLAEWGSVGANANREIRVPVEHFLANLEWLSPICRRFQTGIEWDDASRTLVGRTREERSSLQRIRDNLVPLATKEVLEQLARGRFVRALRDFQLRDLGKLLVLPNGANFSVPGAGKTAVTYALYECERQTSRVDRLLVVAPISAFDAWITEAAACFETTPVVHRVTSASIPANAEICLVNYQRLTISYETVARWAQGGRCHTVLDEAHRMKRGWTGEWGRASLNLAYLAARRDVLTGTPAPQSLRDLDAILDFAWPTQARRVLPASIFQRNPPPGATAQVRDAVAPLFVRTTKSDLSLPKPTMIVIPLKLEGLQREIYQALRDQYAGRLPLSRSERSSFARMGQVVMFLLEAATNPRLLPFGDRPDPATARPRFPLNEIPANSRLADLIAQYNEYENPPKFAALAQLLRDNAALGRKTLVWTNFVANIALLKEAFSGLRPAAIYGDIPSDSMAPTATTTRESELDRFRNDADCLVLLANPAATSEGISLHHHCHDAIYLDRTFNAGQYLQSVDRIHRLGMEKDVETRITFLLTEGTVDFTVDNRVREKAQRLGAILNDDDIATMALPDDDDVGEIIAEDDLAALFAHLRGEDENLPGNGA
jgi:SNF2 family DNA or RNA helicase